MKILIVDDETPIREWLDFCIKDNSEYQIVGHANNGEQALKMFKELMPEIVLTDVKMPLMNGLELLKEIKSIKRETIVILLTAYSEFEFARIAMREGATEYILKTEITSETLNETLARAVAENKKNKGNSDEDIDNSAHKQIVLRKVCMKEEALNKEDIRLLNECNINISNNGIFAIAVWKKQILDNFTFPKCKNIKNVVGFEYDDEIYVVVGNVSEASSALTQNSYLNEFTSKIIESNKCIIGVANIFNNLMNINNMVLEAVLSLSEGFYNENIKIYNVGTKKYEMKKARDEWDIQFKHFFYKEIYSKLGKDQIASFQEALDYIEKNKVPAIESIKMFCSEILDIIYVRYRTFNSDLSKELLETTKKKIEEALFFKEAKDIAISFVKDNIWIDELDEKKLSRSILKAVSYIRHHYNEPLTLSQIAEEVDLNAEYLSRSFKEETGETYSNFLANIRLSKAEALLINTSVKICDIAEAVGYPNVSYFSTVFKKRYGLNPFEFRRDNYKNLNE